MSFGFGKALDRLRDGAGVTRAAWAPFDVFGPPQPAIQLMAQVTVPREGEDAGARIMAPMFTCSRVAAFDDVFIEPWMPTHADLLAEDWEDVDA